MPSINAVVDCPIRESFRVEQVRGMFGLPSSARCRQEFSVDVPGVDEPWQIGAIIGRSGSGKTTVARAAFGGCVARPNHWPRDRAVIDCFGQRSIKEVTQTLTAVGFSSPPAWLRPYHTLSTGERFRCDLAKAFLTPTRSVSEARRHAGLADASGWCVSRARRRIVVCDEFTSVVDRAVARMASAAVSKAIRSGKLNRRLVAVTCHDDVLAWLEPDWALDMGTGQLTRGRLRRPPIRLRLFRCRREAWSLFARHHYLSADLPYGTTCVMGIIDARPAAFAAWLPMFGRRGVWRIARLVVLPDYQGVGIGAAMLRVSGELIASANRRATITTSHPAMIAHLRASPDWLIRGVKPLGGNRSGIPSARYRSSAGRAVVSAEFVPSSRGTP
ncbi:MAG TPA: GNAT family N-acetyltransferase [Pirellulales bacterium]|nr:GNAT family N-acetyltransferase [Pirellulales bacterium]